MRRKGTSVASSDHELAVADICKIGPGTVSRRSETHMLLGGPGGNRTPDQRLRSPLLYPLSYGPAPLKQPRRSRSQL